MQINTCKEILWREKKISKPSLESGKEKIIDVSILSFDDDYNGIMLTRCSRINIFFQNIFIVCP